MTGQRWQRLATAISVRAWQAKDDKDWLQRSQWEHDRTKMTKTGYSDLSESMTGQKRQRLATAISVRAWQAKDDKDWLQRSQWEHDRPKTTKTGYSDLSESTTGQRWQRLATTVPSKRENCALTRCDDSNQTSFRCSQCNRQMLQFECHLCSSVRAYWMCLSVSSEVSCLPLRTRDKNLYIRLSRDCVLWRTPFTTVHFLEIYPLPLKRMKQMPSKHYYVRTKIYHIS